MTVDQLTESTFNKSKFAKKLLLLGVSMSIGVSHHVLAENPDKKPKKLKTIQEWTIPEQETITFVIPYPKADTRVRKALQKVVDDENYTRIVGWIENGHVIKNLVDCINSSNPLKFIDLWQSLERSGELTEYVSREDIRIYQQSRSYSGETVDPTRKMPKIIIKRELRNGKIVLVHEDNYITTREENKNYIGLVEKISKESNNMLNLSNIEDKTGYDFVGSFVDGLAPAFKGNSCGYINMQGVTIINPKFKSGKCFSEGLAAVKVDGLWGYIDRKGDVVIEPGFGFAEGFSEGLAVASSGTNKRGYINRDGKFVIKQRFDRADRFSEGLAPVKQNGLWGYIDRKGEFFIPPGFEYAGHFFGGVAKVYIGDNKLYITKDGTKLNID